MSNEDDKKPTAKDVKVTPRLFPGGSSDSDMPPTGFAALREAFKGPAPQYPPDKSFSLPPGTKPARVGGIGGILTPRKLREKWFATLDADASRPAARAAPQAAVTADDEPGASLYFEAWVTLEYFAFLRMGTRSFYVSLTYRAPGPTFESSWWYKIFDGEKAYATGESHAGDTGTRDDAVAREIVEAKIAELLARLDSGTTPEAL